MMCLVPEIDVVFGWLQVIPFLPFEQEHIAEIIALKLAQLDENYRNIYWHRLWIDVRLFSPSNTSSIDHATNKSSYAGSH